MEAAMMFVNVPHELMTKALAHEIPDNHKALTALDKGLDVVLIEKNIYLASEYAVAIGNAWCRRSEEDTAFFSATEWHKYAKTERSPDAKGFYNSFAHFLRDPVLLVVVGLSFMQTNPSRAAMDEVLHKRAITGKRSLIAGWNAPAGEFVFNENQELAIDSTSMFPLLHQRSRMANMTLMTSAGSK